MIGTVDRTRRREIVALREVGETGPAPTLPNLEDRYNTRYTITMAKRLTPSELATVAQAAALREEGLHLARSGADADGAELVDRARKTAEAGALGVEATLCAESFQLAAEAFVRYAHTDLGDAESLLLASMGACARLGDEFGYRVSMRRVHLGRNVVRVVGAAGRTGEATELAHGLVRLLEGDADAWPWPGQAMLRPDPLTDDVRHFLMDQVLAEVARLTAATYPDLPVTLAAGDRLGLFTAPGTSGFARPRAWLRARRCAAVGDGAGFLDGAAVFFAEPPGRYGAAWRALGADLDRLAAEPG